MTQTGQLHTIHDRATVCLSMIVKNETPVLEETLNSVKPLIDHWVICDTGSTDGTQDLIRELMADIPGQLHERPWRNFGHNRSEAIDLAGDVCDYLLFIDADETVVFEPGFTWPTLTAGAYQLLKTRQELAYRLPSLVRTDRRWRWCGVVHEYLDSEYQAEHVPLDGVVIDSNRRGARSRDPSTYKRDAILLEQGLLDEPDNQRYVYYLAQSYQDCGDLDLAIRNFEKRATIGGWEEEVYHALYQAAKCRQRRGDDWPVILDAFLKAHSNRPARAEPLYAIACHYATIRDFPAAMIFLESAAQIPKPEDILFLEPDVYDFHIPGLIAVCHHYTGRPDLAKSMNEELLARPDLPASDRERIEKNLEFAIAEIARKKAA